MAFDPVQFIGEERSKETPYFWLRKEDSDRTFIRKRIRTSWLGLLFPVPWVTLAFAITGLFDYGRFVAAAGMMVLGIGHLIDLVRFRKAADALERTGGDNFLREGLPPRDTISLPASR